MDLVTFGEGLIRLSPASDRRRAEPELVAYVGGSELNVAIAAAHIGCSSRWISRLPSNALGRFIDGAARMHGVDSRIEWADDGRVGLYFLEAGAAPRQLNVVYDRAGSAFSRIARESVDWRSEFSGARWFHTSGITPALSESAAEATEEALLAAKSAGLTVSYDVNYRVKLWDASRARAVHEPLLQHVDVLIVSRDDARTVFDVNEDSAESVARTLAQRYGVTVVAVTDRDSTGTSAAVAANGSLFTALQYEVDVVERVGTGDAFTAGLITHRLQGHDWSGSVRFAAATAALKLTMPGDFFVGDAQRVEALLQRQPLKVLR